MNNLVVLQLWEESERNWGVRPDGCTLHYNIIECEKYIQIIYSDRNPESVPDEYVRTCGEPLYVTVTDDMYKMIKKEKTILIPQSAFNNLRKMHSIQYVE